MNTTTKNILRLAACFLLGIFMLNLMSLIAIAQVATNAPPTGDAGPSLEIFKTLKPIEFLLIPLVTVLIQAARKFIPKIPSAVWPWAGPFIGAILDYVATKAGLWTGNVAVGAMLGGLATWLHQLDKNSVNVLGKLLPPASSPPATG
jgi:hypothetical protein